MQRTSFSETPEGEIHILMSKEQRKHLQKEALAKQKARKMTFVQTLNTLNKKSNQLFEHLYRNFDLKEDLVRNVIAYVKCLPKAGSEVIDKNIFDAQMKRHFKLTDVVLLERMYHVCCIDDRNCKVMIDEYCELICIFLTQNRDLKVQFVFRVYNWRGDGFLSKKDLEYFIKPMVSQVNAVDENDEDNAWQYFVEMLVNICDQNHDDQVELDEFRELVGQNILMMTCLGPCLPNEEERIAFNALLKDKTNIETSAMFRFERRISLCQPKIVRIEGIQSYYPVQFELP